MGSDDGPTTAAHTAEPTITGADCSNLAQDTQIPRVHDENIQVSGLQNDGVVDAQVPRKRSLSARSPPHLYCSPPAVHGVCGARPVSPSQPSTKACRMAAACTDTSPEPQHRVGAMDRPAAALSEVTNTAPRPSSGSMHGSSDGSVAGPCQVPTLPGTHSPKVGGSDGCGHPPDGEAIVQDYTS